MNPTARPWRWLIAAVALGAACLPLPAAAQPLAVPFLPQTEELCGGAAAAMVMRYWGAADAYPDAFQPLVDRAAHGIRTAALSSDLERRGWIAVSGPGDDAEIAKELGRRRPVIALILDRPGRYHYVVVVDRSTDHVIVHDPARGPNRTIDRARFDAAWEASGRWMLILLPGSTAPASGAAAASAEPAAAPPAGGGTCEALVDEGVGQAATDRSRARALLLRATADCPNEAAPWRELAGLDALDTNWAAAEAHASRAAAIDSRDALAWGILATARYLRHDDAGALAAWNQVGEPKVRLVDVKGLQHTRYDVMAGAIGVPLKAVLTPDAMKMAERRVRDVPAVAAARVTFHPVENGEAQIDAAVVERNRGPFGYGAWIRAGFDAVTGREISANFSNVSGGGDAAGVTWRWWEHRPMVAGFYAAPAPSAIGGVWRLDASRETQTFGDARFAETRTRAGLTLARWMTDRLRLTAGLALERWQARGEDAAIAGGAEQWMAADRLRFQADVAQAIGAGPYTTAGVSAAVRSKSTNDGFVVFGLTGYRAASDSSPASVWPGADTGHARDVLLRAHPLLDDGVIDGGAFGRRLAFATVEAQRWTMARRLPIRLAPAAFVDLARATRGLDATNDRLQIDAGGGLRIALPGAGVMRIDVARGVRDGGTVLSAAWDRRWR